MHIEPGVVDGVKILLGYGTAAASLGVVAKLVVDTLRTGTTVSALAARSGITTATVLTFFQILPHPPVGVSEVHLILGSTLFLLLGAGPAAIGLAAGLLLQGLFFAPFDLPQYGMNVTTLLVPLVAVSVLARRIIPGRTRYADVSYKQTLMLSATYQGGIVGWVAFWAFWGQGVTAESLAAVGTFGAAYMLVIGLEPLIDLGLLATAKALDGRAARWVLHPQVLARI